MTFPPGGHLKRANFARITASERDGIVEALKANPSDLEGIAARFNRSPGTIEKIRSLRA